MEGKTETGVRGAEEERVHTRGSDCASKATTKVTTTRVPARDRAGMCECVRLAAGPGESSLKERPGGGGERQMERAAGKGAHIERQ